MRTGGHQANSWRRARQSPLSYLLSMPSSWDPKKWSHGVWLIAVSVVLAILTVAVAVADNKLAAGVLQAGTLVFSTYGAWLLSKHTAAEAGREGVRRQARPAFRRVLNLYAAIIRQGVAVQEETNILEGLAVSVEGRDFLELAHVRGSMRRLHAMTVEQAATGRDALDDWRDIVPQEVAELEARGEQRELP